MEKFDEKIIEELKVILRGAVVLAGPEGTLPIKFESIKKVEGGMEVEVSFGLTVEDLRKERGIAVVNCGYMYVGVHKECARERKYAFVKWIGRNLGPDFLKSPSISMNYKKLGEAIGSDQGALATFAFGEVLELWHVVTPQSLGIREEEAIVQAEAGGVFIIAREATTENKIEDVSNFAQQVRQASARQR